MNRHYDPYEVPSPRRGQTRSELSDYCQKRLGDFGDRWRAGRANTYRECELRGRPDTAYHLPDAIWKAGGSISRYEAVSSCASRCWIWQRIGSTETRMKVNFCNHRLCPICARRRGNRIRKAILLRLPKPQRGFTFLTITQPHRGGEPLDEQLSRLTKNFHTLRTAAIWKDSVVAGFYAIEVQYSKTWTQTLSCHIHALVDATWIDQDALSALWNSYQPYPSSKLIHMSAVENTEHVVNYISKYITKPIPDAIMQDPDLLELAIRGLRGHNLWNLVGAWHGLALSDTAARHKAKAEEKALSYGLPTPRQHEDPDEWSFLGDIHEIINDARAGSAADQDKLEKIGFGRIPIDTLSPLTVPQSRAPPTEPQGKLALCA